MGPLIFVVVLVAIGQSVALCSIGRMMKKKMISREEHRGQSKQGLQIQQREINPSAQLTLRGLS
jgi:cytochrome c biogenesis protein ResB